MMKKTILLGINEINVDFIKDYVKKGYLPNFKKLLQDYGYTQTQSENEYELWEPWIQWVTIHTGKTYDEHKIFRLGDIVERKDIVQLWEIAAKEGLTVGAISPFNADNRTNAFKFFVPDPWTSAKPAGAPYLVNASRAVSQAVNDNASKKVTVSSLIHLLTAMVKTIPFKRYGHYFRSLLNVRNIGGRALILDNLLADIFLYEWRKHKPDFSSLFLNTGAHFQHHYMFNSIVYSGRLKNPEWYCPADQDPLKEILISYDKVVGELLALNVRLIICTGLHQNPHEHVTYYWRLKDHRTFLQKIGIHNATNIQPRMSRDFLVEFGNEADAKEASGILSSLKAEKDGEGIFLVDNRKTSLFVELIYPEDIGENFTIGNGDLVVNNFKDYISFVAIKNGEHDGIGYYIDTASPQFDTNKVIPLTNVFNIIKSSFRSVKPEPVESL